MLTNATFFSDSVLQPIKAASPSVVSLRGIHRQEAGRDEECPGSVLFSISIAQHPSWEMMPPTVGVSFHFNHMCPEAHLLGDFI